MTGAWETNSLGNEMQASEYRVIVCPPNYLLQAEGRTIYMAQGFDSVLGYLRGEGIVPPY